jgi:hypothetical protein
VAGERWEQLRQFFTNLDVSPLDELREQWSYFGTVVGRARYELTVTKPRLDLAGLEGAVYDSLSTLTSGLPDAFAEVAGEADQLSGYFDGAHGFLLRLRQDFVVADHEFPVVLSADPDLRLSQEIRLGEFDLLADDYWGSVLSLLTGMAPDIDAVPLAWPGSLPQTDPSADAAAVGGG